MKFACSQVCRRADFLQVLGFLLWSKNIHIYFDWRLTLSCECESEQCVTMDLPWETPRPQQVRQTDWLPLQSWGTECSSAPGGAKRKRWQSLDFVAQVLYDERPHHVPTITCKTCAETTIFYIIISFLLKYDNITINTPYNFYSITSISIISLLQYLTWELDAIDSVLRASVVTGSPVKMKLLQSIGSSDWTSSQSWQRQMSKIIKDIIS